MPRNRIQGHRRIASLTWEFVHVFCAGCLKASAHVPHELVAGCEDDDADERHEEGEGRMDVPLRENDAQIGSVPSEQHLD